MFTEENSIVRTTGRAAMIGGVAGLTSLIVVLAGEISQGEAFMGTDLAAITGFLGFMGACLLVLGLVGLNVRYSASLGKVGQTALLVLTFASTVMAGVASILALIVPDVATRFPEFNESPPPAVPATFIISGLVMGISALVLAFALRRSVGLSRRLFTLLVIAAVVTIVPLPSRYFLLSVAVAALLLLDVPQAARARSEELVGAAG